MGPVRQRPAARESVLFCVLYGRFTGVLDEMYRTRYQYALSIQSAKLRLIYRLILNRNNRFDIFNTKRMSLLETFENNRDIN